MIIATLIRKDQIVHSIALAKSVKAHHPEAIFVACLIQHLIPAKEALIFDEIITINNKNFPADSLENYCGARAYLIRHLLETYENEKIIYLDPETQVFSRFEEVISLLDSHSIIAAPYHLEIVDSIIEIERMHSGFLYAGFLALRNSDIAKRFAVWWSDHIDRDFYGPQSGISADHKWLSLAMVPYKIHLLKNASYQMAPWNLHEAGRQMTCDEGGQFIVGGMPLRSFHYTLSEVLVDHQLRTAIPDINNPLYAMVQSYKDELYTIRLEGGFL